MNLPMTTLTCQAPPMPDSSSSNDYYGNRGINLYTSNVFTPYNSLANSIAPENFTVINELQYDDNSTSDKTIWLKGFLNPLTTSAYGFNLVTNGYALLYISTDNSSTNKVLKLSKLKNK